MTTGPAAETWVGPPAPSGAPARTAASGVARTRLRAVVTLVALAAVLVRLPFLDRAPGRDEAGFLVVGHQWRAGGTSLYGDLWVDRPPLLITIFRIAADLGGIVALRLIGCLAVVLIVLGVAYVARRIGGPVAASWSAALAATLCATPLLGGLEVNGELLSAPFVVLGIAGATVAVQDHPTPRARVAAAVAGAATVAAIMVKQNIADVAVFGVVAALVALVRRDLPRSFLVRAGTAYAVSAGACLLAVAVWTSRHGTSLVGVFDAMYPFRIRAGRVMAASDRTVANARLAGLAGRLVLSGGAVVMGFAVVAAVTRRLRSPVAWGLLATLVFDLVSIALGGSYWSHYLVQLIVPVSILAGPLAAGRQRGIRVVLVASIVSAAVACATVLGTTSSSTGTTVGSSIAAAARPGDTIVVLYGNADVVLASGLGSPYPYLWSLPVRTLDPSLEKLDSVLRGPDAPTWVVVWHSTATPENDGAGPARLLEEHYHRVGVVGGRSVYLHDAT